MLEHKRDNRLENLKGNHSAQEWKKIFFYWCCVFSLAKSPVEIFLAQ